ncbi:MAG: helix-turn-helix transcriptional regulator, partial [Gemmatimonadaceae bacterium]
MSPVTLNLRALREAAGLTQAQLAEAVNVRQATISDLETGKAKTLRLSLLDALAKALGVSARELIEESAPRR